MGSLLRARLNEIGSWLPLAPLNGQWIEVDLGSISMVTKMATQGSHNQAYWVTQYMVSYSFDGGYNRFYQPASTDNLDTVMCDGRIPSKDSI